MASKTARASMRAGAVMEKPKDPFATPEAKIKELRNQRENNLFVNRMDFVDALIAENDKLTASIADAIAGAKAIADEVIDLRKVVEIQAAEIASLRDEISSKSRTLNDRIARCEANEREDQRS